MKITQKILIFLLLVSTAPFSFALSGYQYEIIVFTHVNAQSLNAERWPNSTKQPFNLTHAINLTPHEMIKDLKVLGPESFNLAPEQERLNKFSPYKTILHVAWRESLLEAYKPKTFHLYGGRLYDDRGHVIQTVTNESYPYSPSQQWELNGKVSIRLNHYFDVNFNLQLSIPNQQAVALAGNNTSLNQGQIFNYFQLIESRRLKSNELNYIDHPLYGVLFKIIPVR